VGSPAQGSTLGISLARTDKFLALANQKSTPREGGERELQRKLEGNPQSGIKNRATTNFSQKWGSKLQNAEDGTYTEGKEYGKTREEAKCKIERRDKRRPKAHEPRKENHQKSKDISETVEKNSQGTEKGTNSTIAHRQSVAFFRRHGKFWWTVGGETREITGKPRIRFKSFRFYDSSVAIAMIVGARIGSSLTISLGQGKRGGTRHRAR